MSSGSTPHGWESAPIESCLLPYPNGKKIRQGWSPQCKNHPAQSQHDWAVLKTSAIQDGYFVDSENKQLPKELEPRTHLEVEAGDILMTCAGPRARCGVTCIVRSTRPRLLISGKMYQLRADPQIVDRHFLELYLRDSKTKKKIDEMKTGISDSGLNLTHDRFRALTIPLPPLAEQKRIVAKIEELFSELEAGEESLRVARRQLATYRQSLLKQAFEGKLTTPLKSSYQWRKTTLGEITRIRTGKLDANAESLSGKFPFFTCGEETRRIDVAAFDTEAVLLAGNGNFGVKYYKGQFNAYQRTYVIEPAGVDGRWLFFLVVYRVEQIKKAARGSTIPYLRLGDIADCPILVPPLPEQHEIVRLLDEQFEVIERNEREIDAALQRSEALRQSILHRAFTGKLVPQDPADEPATELLARLSTERAAELSSKSTAKPSRRRK